MRLDGALEPRPRYGAVPFKGRFPLRRETREQCESQQQQSADEDDEATDAECLTNDNNNNNTINSRNNINNWPANRAKLNLQPATLRTTKQRSSAGPGAGNLKRCSMVATLKTRAPPSLMLMGQKDLHSGSRKTRMKAAGRKGARGGGGAGAGAGPGPRSGWERLNSSLVLLLISVIALMPPLTLGDDGDNFFAVNAFSAGPETTTPEFDYASRGQKKFGDKCENTLECGFPGSICDPKKKSCQCTEDLPVTNHIDKCGKEAAVNESCFFNEQCEMKYFQTECRDGRCICRFEMSPIWGKDGSVECKGRQDKRGPEDYIDPAMIGVLVGMALMFIIICVVLRLFSQARWRENRTIFNTPNPRLMNVSLLRDSKLLHGQERRGSRMSVRAPSRQPSMASLRPHSPNPSLGSHSESHGSASNASATSVRSNRSNSVAPGKVGHHERHGSAHRQHHPHGGHHHQQQQQSHPQSPQDQSLVTNITTNPVAESVTVEIIEPGQK
ncbi:uncharacterized protein Dana_GF18410, isoform C [Drosophila ananassae]|uniref:Uncharacterized protein, isoform C n=1 Tax=Drosophila ananassae TaxID=7217 RepID=A0A0P8Y053_DROAN|nr:uncharacterized protein LOC6501184 isoform X2 [Drosophila ananassae]KPU80175.1 uncharacterized protein Dana_GF18410, isoform C [Drosophila ananassae]